MSTTVYVVMNYDSAPNGVFSTRELAEQAVARDCCGPQIIAYEIDTDHCKCDMCETRCTA